jgi:competence protein ComEA
LKKEINPLIPSSFRVLNINRATKAQIETLPLIGPELSKRIIQYREKFGALRSCEEIMKIKGIGKKRFERIKELIKVD